MTAERVDGGTAEPGTTDAQRELLAELGRILVPAGRWRVGVLALSYKKPGVGKFDVNIASAIAAQQLGSAEDALDLVLLVRRLRSMADDLDTVLQGNAPLPPAELGRAFRALRALRERPVTAQEWARLQTILDDSTGCTPEFTSLWTEVDGWRQEVMGAG